MATLALKPAFSIRTRSSGSKRDHPKRRRTRAALHARPWQTIAITSGAIALTFFCVLAPLADDPAGRLFALDTAPTNATEGTGSDAWTAGPFEFTPTTLGPAITAEMLVLAEAEEEDDLVVMMPELEVRAMPPVEDHESTPPG